MSWQDAYEHGSLLLLPPADVGEMVDGLRRRYDPASFHRCRAHITLTQPLLAPLDGKAHAKIGAVLAVHPPLHLSYGPVEVLKGRVVVFRIEPRSAVLDLRDALHELGLFDLTLPYTDGFIPHMTVSERGVSDPLHALPGLHPEMARGVFRCDRVHHMVPSESFVFSENCAFAVGTHS